MRSEGPDLPGRGRTCRRGDGRRAVALDGPLSVAGRCNDKAESNRDPRQAPVPCVAVSEDLDGLDNYARLLGQFCHQGAVDSPLFDPWCHPLHRGPRARFARLPRPPPPRAMSLFQGGQLFRRPRDTGEPRCCSRSRSRRTSSLPRSRSCSPTSAVNSAACADSAGRGWSANHPTAANRTTLPTNANQTHREIFFVRFTTEILRLG